MIGVPKDSRNATAMKSSPPTARAHIISVMVSPDFKSDVIPKGSNAVPFWVCYGFWVRDYTRLPKKELHKEGLGTFTPCGLSCHGLRGKDRFAIGSQACAVVITVFKRPLS